MCIHSEDMEPEWCSLCLGKADIASPVVAARYTTTCPGCGGDINPGQMTVQRNLRWFHRGCR